MEGRLSNYDRLYKEIGDAAQRLAPKLEVDPGGLVKLVMEIVDLEDQNRIKSVARIRQRVEGLIESATTVDTTVGE